MISSQAGLVRRPFQFERDTFAFANQLVWEYRFDPQTGGMRTVRSQPPPTYAHRCFVMVRSARQFLYHARFEASQAPVETRQYRQLVRAVVSRSPRRPSDESIKIVIPGFDCLRVFSEAHEALLKAQCGGAWQSYLLRSHWRMTLPFTRNQQQRTAHQLVQAFDKKSAPIVHLVRFPQLTINHGIVLFDYQQTESQIIFKAYDPNIPAHPTELIYHREERTFYFPRNHYWPGGKLDVVEVYRGWLY